VLGDEAGDPTALPLCSQRRLATSSMRTPRRSMSPKVSSAAILRLLVMPRASMPAGNLTAAGEIISTPGGRYWRLVSFRSMSEPATPPISPAALRLWSRLRHLRRVKHFRLLRYRPARFRISARQLV
jgi:hypothetical protein